MRRILKQIDYSPACARERLASHSRDPQCCLSKAQVEMDRAIVAIVDRKSKQAKP